ncbi:MAG: fumarylacetoacetate hydrolase family protein [Acidimicrobiia bacterium]|nr:fumarylacetoacetate hydrolase family protein [Acidimicrobiia bacterium]
MGTTRRQVIGSVLAAYGISQAQAPAGVKKYVRYKAKTGDASWGLLEGESIRRLTAAPYEAHKAETKAVKLSDVKLLAPAEPPKIFAVGLNYRSHLGNRPAPANPEIFYKPITSLQDPDGPIVIPKTALNVHYEAELVLVMGKKTKNATAALAKSAIFGVTCGNDVSERDWQNGEKKDLQWWRAKGADTFAPCGPVLVSGLDYGKLLLTGRLNGEEVQKQYTSDLLFDAAAIVSYISQAVTLQPGDLIYTGTPGTTKKMMPGDVVEVELEGVGILKNKVAGA